MVQNYVAFDAAQGGQKVLSPVVFLPSLEAEPLFSYRENQILDESNKGDFDSLKFLDDSG